MPPELGVLEPPEPPEPQEPLAPFQLLELFKLLERLGLLAPLESYQWRCERWPAVRGPPPTSKGNISSGKYASVLFDWKCCQHLTAVPEDEGEHGEGHEGQKSTTWC